MLKEKQLWEKKKKEKPNELNFFHELKTTYAPKLLKKLDERASIKVTVTSWF